MRLVIVPRWAGGADSDFYPWLREQLADAFDSVVTVKLAPSADAPKIEASVASLRAQLSGETANTILLAHSVGCQIVMRTLAEPDTGPVAATLLVAGWFAIDEPWDTIRPWVEEPIDTEQTRASIGALRVLVSTDDRYTADYRATQAAFESRLGAKVRLVDGSNHFNGSRQPEVLEELQALLAEHTR